VKGNGIQFHYHQVDTLHIYMYRLWLRFRSEGGWKEEKYLSFSGADSGECGTVIGDIVTSNKSARVNRVNECLNLGLHPKYIVYR